MLISLLNFLTKILLLTICMCPLTTTTHAKQFPQMQREKLLEHKSTQVGLILDKSEKKLITLRNLYNSWKDATGVKRSELRYQILKENLAIQNLLGPSYKAQFLPVYDAFHENPSKNYLKFEKKYVAKHANIIYELSLLSSQEHSDFWKVEEKDYCEVTNEDIDQAKVRLAAQNILGQSLELKVALNQMHSSLKELQGLFVDMQILVSDQQQYIDQMENDIRSANRYLEKGKIDLNEAVCQQKKSRTKQLQILATLGIGALIGGVKSSLF